MKSVQLLKELSHIINPLIAFSKDCSFDDEVPLYACIHQFMLRTFFPLKDCIVVETIVIHSSFL